MRSLLAALALASLLAGCGSAAGPGPSPSGDVVEVTRGDDGKTIDVRVGQVVQVSLGDDLDWAVEIGDTTVLAAEPGVNTLVRGTQLLARARAAGTTTLTATGKPKCAPSQPCALFLVLFTVTVVVH